MMLLSITQYQPHRIPCFINDLCVNRHDCSSIIPSLEFLTSAPSKLYHPFPRVLYLLCPSRSAQCTLNFLVLQMCKAAWEICMLVYINFRLEAVCSRWSNDWNESKNVLFHGLVIWYALLHIFFSSLCSATSVDVEEGLYKKAQALGISVVTISQVCCVLRWVSRSFFVPSLNTCIMCHLHKGSLNTSHFLKLPVLVSYSLIALICLST